MEEKQTDKVRKQELLLAGVAFTLFWLINCHKLLNASLWFDETIEYWYSKIMFGELPFEPSKNMYDRIVSTFQPPLYNVIMYFWLKINDTELWFRFFGVVIGFLGMIGIYQSVKRICNPVTASLAVIFSSTVYRLCYYWQECAEYGLMIACLCWTIYFWTRLVQQTNKKNIILFTLSAVFPVYSQYGAVFPVFAMLITACAVVFLQKDRKNIFTLVLSYFCAFVFAAVPLYWFFLKAQVLRQQGDQFWPDSINYSGLLVDWWESLKIDLEFNLFPFYSKWVIRIFLIAVFLLSAVIIIVGKNRLLKWMIVFNVITYAVYYFAVRLELYSYGDFGARYGLFLAPLWIVLTFGIGYCCYDILHRLGEKTIWRWNLPNMEFLFAGSCLCFILCYGAYNWSSGIQNNWTKEDIRGAVTAWYAQRAYEKDTIVYYGASSGFACYLQQNEDYTKGMDTSVHYMPWMRNKSVEEYTAYINGIYGGDNWPGEVYIAASHMAADVNTLIECFTQRGYEETRIFNDRARLIYLNVSFTD